MISSRRETASYYKPHIWQLGTDWTSGNQFFMCSGLLRDGDRVIGYGVSEKEAYQNWCINLPYKECQYHLEYINRGK